MGDSRFDVENTEVQMIMVIELLKLQRDELPSLTYQNLEQYLSQDKWKDHQPGSLHEAAEEILAVNASDIVKFLSQKAIEEGSTSKLTDYPDVIGGK